MLGDVRDGKDMTDKENVVGCRNPCNHLALERG
jgi:hypothetical protein